MIATVALCCTYTTPLRCAKKQPFTIKYFFMQNKLTLWQRACSDTPAFFRGAQVFGISLAGLGTSLAQVSGIPPKLCTIMISAGSAITILAQFAVKQYQPLNTNDHA
jgi:hypothetical protein